MHPGPHHDIDPIENSAAASETPFVPRRRARISATLLAVFAIALATDPAAADPDSGASFAEVEATVRRHFSAIPGFQHGDIVSRSQAQEAFEFLDKTGWVTSQRKLIEKRFLADSHFVVRQLRTKRGTPFMRKVAAMPRGFDRLDRLSSISGGRKVVSDLIKGKDGYRMLEYMTSTKGGKNLSAQLANAKGGKNFQKPTERIYTLDQFIAALRKAYEFDAQAKSSSATKDP